MRAKPLTYPFLLSSEKRSRSLANRKGIETCRPEPRNEVFPDSLCAFKWEYQLPSMSTAIYAPPLGRLHTGSYSM